VAGAGLVEHRREDHAEALTDRLLNLLGDPRTEGGVRECFANRTRGNSDVFGHLLLIEATGDLGFRN
jgi:hypothetical protein